MNLIQWFEFTEGMCDRCKSREYNKLSQEERDNLILEVANIILIMEGRGKKK